MNAMNQALSLILSTAGHILLMLFWLRYLMQLVQADFYNPAAQGIVRFTDPLLKPLRASLPPAPRCPRHCCCSGRCSSCCGWPLTSSSGCCCSAWC